MFIACTALFLSGCAEDANYPHVDDWNKGAELQAHMTGKSHSGAFDARVFPQVPMERPDRCIAYRGSESYMGDTCDIIDETSEHWFPIDNQAWGVIANWEGRFGDTADEADPNFPRTVVAFDGTGTPVAYWKGANHPNATHSTE